jgi:serine/threonine protein kinase
MEVYHPGQIISIRGCELRVEKPLSQGAMAFAYRAVDLASGDPVLFKAYCSPVPDRATCPWFDRYADHQEEIRKRLERIPDQTLRILKHFVHRGAYHQVIEWANGRSLESLLEDDIFAKAVSLERHLHLAKVMLYSLRKIHEEGIIHCDQKPANFFAEENPKLKIGYKVMMSDFDMSLIAGKSSPRPDGCAMAGTFGYHSPEHLRAVPATRASDVFTVGGVMLYQMFAGVHPFQEVADQAADMDHGNRLIRELIESRRIPRMEKIAPTRAAQVPAKVLELIHLAMDPNPARRPKAEEIHQALLHNRLATTLVLQGGPAGLKWRLRDAAPLARTMAERFFGTALGAVSSEQGRFDHSSDRAEWYYTPREGTVNASMINGKEIRSRVTLVSGMKLQVGNPGSGKIGLEMEVSFERGTHTQVSDKSARRLEQNVAGSAYEGCVGGGLSASQLCYHQSGLFQTLDRTQPTDFIA